jgi:L-cysteine S-thiosulfotransferase
MRKALMNALAVSALSAMLVTTGLLFTPVMAADDSVEQGRKIAFDRKLGNCLACHMIQGGALPGNIGPPLVAMKARFPDKGQLRAQVWDATVKNPNSLMPPFGKHAVLSERELDLVVEFIYSL